MLRLFGCIFALPLALAPVGGCGDNAIAPDGAPPVNPRLVIVDGVDLVGLPFGGQATLTVRYENGDGSPILGAPVQFTFVVDGPSESSGGSSLSAASDYTDAHGIAHVDVLAGAERARFRISANATAALPATFFVQVSEEGFTDLVIEPVHGGTRPPEELSPIEVRLYESAAHRCAGLDVEAPPESGLPSRTLDAFGGAARFANLEARAAYTALAWAGRGDGALPLAAGCVELGAEQLRPGQRVLLGLEVDDRALIPPTGVVELSTWFDLGMLDEILAASGADAPWRTLACPAGPGQLLLDCTLDALAGDDAIDCVPGPSSLGAGDLADLLGARRGEPDESGCRPLTDAIGRPSLDQVISEAIAGGAVWPSGPALADLLAERVEVTAGLGLSTELELLGGGLARHRLVRARLILAEQQFVLDLGSTARPVLVQAQVPAVVGADGHLELAEHGFTLRLGSLAAAAFGAVALPAAGLAGRAGSLGAALAESVVDAAGGTSGCPALSSLVCGEAGHSADCLDRACADAAAALDLALTAWWRHLDGAALDFLLGGSAPLFDVNDDLRVDSIGSDPGGQRLGTWSARLVFADGSGLAVGGAFGSATPPQ